MESLGWMLGLCEGRNIDMVTPDGPHPPVSSEPSPTASAYLSLSWYFGICLVLDSFQDSALAVRVSLPQSFHPMTLIFSEKMFISFVVFLLILTHGYFFHSFFFFLQLCTTCL